MTDQAIEGLSASEQAYFDSRGEKDVPAETPETETAEAEAETSTEPEAETGSDAPEGENKRERSKMVPHQALHETREQLRREREDRKRFEETINQRLAMLTQPPPPPPKVEEAPPDPTLDPLGRLEWLEKRFEQTNQTAEQVARQQQEYFVRQQVTAVVQADEAEARKVAPDYDEAKRHLLMSRGKEIWAASGGRLSDQQIMQQLAQEEEALRITAIQQGARPSEAVYRMALARGYTPKQAKAAAEASEERIEGLAKAQDANRSVSSAGGSTAGGPMTATKLANMSPEEFSAYAEKNKATVKRLMGG
jgi:hypothetical protein